MQLYQQVGLCVAPLLGTVVMAFSLLQPTLDEASVKQSQLDSLKQQYDVLEIKLAQKHRLLAKRALIHKEIQKLRTSVPDKPDLDLLIFDLEKMCKTNNTSLLGVEEYDPGRTNKKKENLIESLVQEVGGKLPAKPKKPLQRSQNQKTAEQENTEEVDPLGLKHITRRVYVAGDYQGMLGVLKDLEGYQRIVGVRDIIIAMPEDEKKEATKTLAAEKGKELGLSSPVMTFLLHIYYLPS